MAGDGASLVPTRQPTGTKGAPDAMSPGAPGLLLRPGLVRGLGTLRSQFTAATGTFSPCSWEVPGQPPHPLYWLSWGRRTPPPGHLSFLGSGKAVTPEPSPCLGSHTSERGRRGTQWTKRPKRGWCWGWVTSKDGDLEAGEAESDRADSSRTHQQMWSLGGRFSSCPAAGRFCSLTSKQTLPSL